MVRVARAEKRPWQEVQRARIVLYAAEGLHDTEIADRLDTSRRGSWAGGEGASAAIVWMGSRTSRARVARAVFPPEQVAEVKAIACELPTTHGRPLGRFSRTELHRLVIEPA